MKTSRFIQTALLTTVAIGGSMLLVGMIAPATGLFDDETTTPQEAAQPAFTPGATQQMKDMAWKVGTWDVNATWILPDGSTVDTASTSTIAVALDDCFLTESIEWNWGGQVMKLRGFHSYDQFRKVYRTVWFDSMMGLADIYEGTLTDGTLTADNTRCDTAFPIMTGGLANGRVIISKTSDDRFEMEWSFSQDDGKTWEKSGGMTYTRKN